MPEVLDQPETVAARDAGFVSWDELKGSPEFAASTIEERLQGLQGYARAARAHFSEEDLPTAQLNALVQEEADSIRVADSVSGSLLASAKRGFFSVLSSQETAAARSSRDDEAALSEGAEVLGRISGAGDAAGLNRVQAAMMKGQAALLGGLGRAAGRRAVKKEAAAAGFSSKAANEKLARVMDSFHKEVHDGGDVISFIREDPARLVPLSVNAFLESWPAMAQTITGGLMAGPLGAGGMGFVVEMAGTEAEVLGQIAQERGIDLSDPEALTALMQSEEVRDEMRRKGKVGAIAPAIMDAVSFGIAGGMAKLMRNKGLLGAAINVGTNALGLDPATEFAGEALRQKFVNGEVDWVEAQLEAIAAGPAGMAQAAAVMARLPGAQEALATTTTTTEERSTDQDGGTTREQDETAGAISDEQGESVETDTEEEAEGGADAGPGEGAPQVGGGTESVPRSGPGAAQGAAERASMTGQLDDTAAAVVAMSEEAARTAPPEMGEAAASERAAGDLGPGAAAASEFRDRAFTKRLVEDDRLDIGVRRRLENDKYIPIKLNDTAAEMGAAVEEMGLVQGAAQALNVQGNDLTFGQRVVLAELVAGKINEEISRLRNLEGDDSGQVAFLQDLADDVVRTISSLGTEMGRGIQAFTLWRRMSVNGMVDQWVRQMERETGTAPELDAATRRELQELADQKQKAPENSFLRQEIDRQVMTILARNGGVTAGDVLTAFWYANILSGINTQGVNAYGSGINILMRTLATGLVSNPRGTMEMISAMARAVLGPSRDAFGLGARGLPPLKQEGKFPRISTLELIHDPNPQTLKQRGLNLLSYGKWVGRLLSAVDGFFWRTATEGQAALAASKFARNRPKDQSYRDFMAEQLGRGGTRAAAARAQAAAELDQLLGAAGSSRGAQKRRRRRVELRMFEILEASRPRELREISRRFGDIATFTQEPDGSMAAFANFAKGLISNLAVTIPIGPKNRQTGRRTGPKFEPVRFFAVPFVDIVANVTSSSMDFTPIGAWRAWKGRHVFGHEGMGRADFDSFERRQRAGAALLGTTMTAALALRAAMELDEDDPEFAIYGLGPPAQSKRRQWRQQGNESFSVKIGDTKIKFSETPMAIPLAIVGAFQDRVRFSESFSEEDFATRMGYAFSLFPKAITETGFLSQIANISEMLEGDAKVSNVVIRPVKGLIPAQGLLRDIARLTDPELVDGRQMRAALLKDLPFIESMGTRPALNALGEPVKLNTLQRIPVVSRVMSGKSGGKEFQWLGERGLWISGLTEDISIVLPEGADKLPVIKSLQERRADEMGARAAGVYTQDEAYRFAEETGKLTKRWVQALMALDQRTNGQIPKEEMQKALTSGVSRIRRLVKMKDLGLMTREELQQQINP